jgi:hypothetical protein
MLPTLIILELRQEESFQHHAYGISPIIINISLMGYISFFSWRQGYFACGHRRLNFWILLPMYMALSKGITGFFFRYETV